MTGPVRIEDASGLAGSADRLLSPASEKEVAAALAEAAAARIPVTVVGAGTGVTGGGVPDGGWALSLANLKGIDVGRGRAVAGAGVPLADLHAAAARSGQFYPPDPTETSASLGGTVATNASGSRSFRYGDTRRHLLSLRVALMDGSVREFRRGDPVDFPVPPLPLPATTKHSAGFRLAPGMDWIDLFCGSEGTLGVVTRAEVALLAAPAELFAGVVFFPSDEAALAAVDAWRPCPGLRMLEYFDRASLAMLRSRFDHVPVPAAAALLFEQELDSPDSPEIDLWVDRLDNAAALADDSWFAAGAEDRERFRRFRHALPEIVNDTVRREGFLKLGSDYAVPAARNAEMLAFYRRRLDEEFPGAAVVFGHIGDAHVHVNILPSSPARFEAGRDLMIEFARKAVELGGTVGAEHGLGKRKAALLAIQYSQAQIDAMKDVKRRLDPDWLLGRGTLFETPPLVAS